MRVVLVIDDDPSVRRRIADVLMGAGYGVCETFRADLVPAVPRLDAVVSGVVGSDRFGAPVVAIPEPLDADDLLTRVERAVSAERAA